MTTTTYEPLPGDSIAHACSEAVRRARESGKPVAFDFNGVRVVAEPDSDPDSLAATWCAESDRRAEAWRNSPEGKAAKAKAERERDRMQCETDALMRRLPMAVLSLPRLVRWCAALSKAADHKGVQWKPREVARTITAAGYQRHAHIGKSESAFRDRKVAGEYIVGQASDCMLKGMPPHSTCERFAREAGFLKAAGTEAAP